MNQNTVSKTIEILVATNGQTRVETKGFRGAECREASQFLEQALGKPTHETLSAEYHQTATTEHHVRHGES